MELKELKILTEAKAKGADKAEAAAVDKLMRGMEKKLPNECRYKSWDSHDDIKTIEWITQESSPAQGKECAKTIAKELTDAGFKGWKVLVTIRDDYRGATTKWQGKAKS